MATSYQGFWLIVGMTAAAVVIANITSTEQPRPNSSISSTKSNEVSSPVVTSQRPASIDPPGATPGRTVPPTLIPGASTFTDTTQVAVIRSIDEDIRVAFEAATKVALAVPHSKPVEMIEEGSRPTDELSPLETKEVSSTPKVFDQPAVSVGKEDLPREEVRTATDLNLREGPDAAYVKIETLTNGTNLLVLEKNGKWWRVKSTTSGAEGWINGTFVRPVD